MNSFAYLSYSAGGYLSGLFSTSRTSCLMTSGKYPGRGLNGRLRFVPVGSQNVTQGESGRDLSSPITSLMRTSPSAAAFCFGVSTTGELPVLLMSDKYLPITVMSFSERSDCSCLLKACNGP